MNPLEQLAQYSRRDFLTTSASGVGALAMASMLEQDGLLASDGDAAVSANPLAPKRPHFQQKAKSCIFIFLADVQTYPDIISKT